jgi:hypothetical protein
VHLIRAREDLEMKIEVLYFDGCPNHTATVEAVRQALKSERRSAEIEEVEVRTPEDAEARGFLGSPTVRINGLDIQPEARTLKSYGFGCRTYVEGSARSGAPSASLIRRAVRELGQHESKRAKFTGVLRTTRERTEQARIEHH